MSKYKGLFTFDEDNHRYVPIAQADGIIDTMDYEPDSEPTEPLIKDEKIRKAVRAWAEANEFESVFYDYDDFYGVARFILGETVMIIETNEILKEHRGYTIAELCGEEEE